MKKSKWTHFWDMHSGGGTKEKFQHIYIEAPQNEAEVVFYNRFGHNPNRVSCTCCGPDYSITEGASLARLTGYHRNCDNLEAPREKLYKTPNDPWFEEHYYLEPEEVEDAKSRGYTVNENIARSIGKKNRSAFGKYLTVEEFIDREDVLVIRAHDIKPEERTGTVPEQGYVWQD